jgi:hypothetical protein
MPTSFFQSCLGPSFPQVAGEIFSSETPSRLAPRHCGQSTPCAKDWKRETDTTSNANRDELLIIARGRSRFAQCQTQHRAVSAPELSSKFLRADAMIPCKIDTFARIRVLSPDRGLHDVEDRDPINPARGLTMTLIASARSLLRRMGCQTDGVGSADNHEEQSCRVRHQWPARHTRVPRLFLQ